MIHCSTIGRELLGAESQDIGLAQIMILCSLKRVWYIDRKTKVKTAAMVDKECNGSCQDEHGLSMHKVCPVLCNCSLKCGF